MQLSPKNISRKHFIENTAKTMAVSLLSPVLLKTIASKPSIKAVAFDAYALFDTSTVLAKAEMIYPGKGSELMALWRNRQFEYTWLRSLSKKYIDFFAVTADALLFATTSLKLTLTNDNKDQLMQSVLQMKFVPNAGAILQQLKGMSLQLAILSNATPAMLQAGTTNSGLQGIFDYVISTDSIKTYKPDPAAYQLGINYFKLKKEEILFVAFGGWDAAGAKMFGYPTAWINAAGLPV
jgi:2-haloacid dehalogenase